MESSSFSQHRRGLATVAPFCKGHLSPIWIGSNFQAEPHCCSLLREGTLLGKMYSRLLVANRAPKDAPWTDLFQGPWMANVGIHRCAGAACGAGVCCVLIEISTPRWQSTLPLWKTGQSPTHFELQGKGYGYSGRGPGFELVLSSTP